MNQQISNTAPHWRATMTWRSLRLPVLLAMLAVCAQAQTQTCPVGQEDVGGVCHAVCAEGQARVTSSVVEVGSGPATGCFSDVLASYAKACENMGWLADSLGTFLHLGELVCGIPSQLYPDTGRIQSGSSCFLAGSADRLCTDMYGDPPVFPKAEDHPNVNQFSERGGNHLSDSFVANCARGGNVPGGYPPGHNLNGETECTCDLDSHIGTWPDCTAFPTGLTSAEREGVRTCANQGWDVSTGTAFFKCDIPLISGEGTFDECFFGPGTPQCADVFGAEFAFPEQEDSVRYVFSCGAGMFPAGANTNGATECTAHLRLRLRLFLEGPLR